eukprot:gnl/TRDRNA2_/TRDRNA2_198546_c0_seq1.p1 gnl/TRDRNA2_/TRDRNA2_198546_c0~~gnl/TRDRNA2_/TRDRNA2_198546_c0_seq1.p1  ORF type:complete len:570 (-),score=80.39 gnl/TRDRNA2_/TRDRNA2_198546_c0_seq1:69-1682(-)
MATPGSAGTVMVTGPNGQARQLHVLNAGADMQPQVPQFAAAAVPNDDRDVQLRQIRQRIIYISTLMAVYCVIHPLLSWGLDVATLEDALHKVQEVVSVHQYRAPDAALLFIGGIPSIGISIMIGLLVPLCGYLGVKQGQPWLLCCFSSCNALCGCCGCLSVLGGLLMIAFVCSARPGIETFLTHCDPVQCAPGGMEYTDQPHLIDCFAAGMWDDYKSKFGQHMYPVDCPKVFMQCGEDIANGMRAPVPTLSASSRSPESIDALDELLPDRPGAGREHYRQPLVPHQELYNKDSVQPSWQGSSHRQPSWRDSLRRLGIGQPSWQDGSQGFFDRPSRQRGGFNFGGLASPNERAKPAAAVPLQVQNRPQEMLRNRRSGLPEQHGRAMVPQEPSDPFTECRVANETVTKFHVANVLLPEILPKLVLVMCLKIFLMLPVVVLGCLGFWWGKDLYGRAQGYAQISYPPQVQLQPVLGLTQPPRATDSTMAQPLMQMPMIPQSPTHGTYGTVQPQPYIVQATAVPVMQAQAQPLTSTATDQQE